MSTRGYCEASNEVSSMFLALAVVLLSSLPVAAQMGVLTPSLVPALQASFDSDNLYQVQ